jgi:signal peptidase I
VTDDAELRARIEAQVAARRAGRAPAKRPRARVPAPDAASDPASDASDPASDPEIVDGSGAADADGRSLSPVRPWARTDSAGEAPPEPPRPASNPVPSNPEIVLHELAAEVGAEPLPPGTDLPRRLAAAAAAGPTETGAPDPPVDPPTPRRPLLARLLNRRGGDDEPYEPFTLPEPDAAFERPWLRPEPPAPTRSWDGPGAADAPAAPSTAPGTDPAAEPPSEAAVESRTPSRRESRHRPSPQGRHRPTPSRGTTSATPPSVRSLGIAGATPTDRPSAHRAADRGISGATAWGTTNGHSGAAPDLAKFLEAPEPRTGAEPEPDGRDGRDGRDGTDGRHARRPQRARRALVRTLVVVVIAAVAAMLLRAFVVQPYYIPSASMEPTLHGCPGCNDDHVLVDKISYRAHDVRSGDIVVFHRPPNAVGIPEKVLIKRVIALPGDVVELKRGKVYVNGLVLDEPYLNKACGTNATIPLTDTTRWKIPGNDVFVMGDNRCHSDDSRMFGPISRSSIIGRAFAIIWPVNRIGLL